MSEAIAAEVHDGHDEHDVHEGGHDTHSQKPDGYTSRPDKEFGVATGGKVGMWLFLLTDAMSFSGMLLCYGLLRAGHHTGTGPNGTWLPPASWLGINFTACTTFVLILSSVSMVMAFSAAQARDQRKLCIFLGGTILGGLTFLGGQVYEYTNLFREGYTISRGNEMGTFFTVTSFHGLHVFSGVVYLTIILIGALKGKYSKGDPNMVEIVGLFWHFVDLVWILVFTFVYLL